MRPKTALLALLFCVGLSACERKKTDCPSLQIRLDNVIGGRERLRREVQMREFLWTNWHERKCATLHLQSISKEGKETDADYEIRTLPGRTLAIIVTIKRARYGYQGQIFWHEDGKYDVYKVDRVQPNKPEWLMVNPKAAVNVVPEGAKLSGSDYCLRFSGWGDQVLSFF